MKVQILPLYCMYPVPGQVDLFINGRGTDMDVSEFELITVQAKDKSGKNISVSVFLDPKGGKNGPGVSFIWNNINAKERVAITGKFRYKDETYFMEANYILKSPGDDKPFWQADKYLLMFDDEHTAISTSKPSE
ncbi:MAG: hypothetical protein HZA50_19715 [Planctomycetes bacterium]|nr:hypothetical protein [Planctomycetota bacterium]